MSGPQSPSGKSSNKPTLSGAIARFGKSARSKLSNPSAVGEPEDQLRAPFELLLVVLASSTTPATACSNGWNAANSTSSSAALVEGYARTDYQCEDLDAEALAVVVRPAHPRAKARRLTLADLADQPWILQPRGSPMRELLEQEFRTPRLDSPPHPVETASILTTLDLIAQTDMVAVIPASVAARRGRHGLLAVLPLRLTQQMEPYGSIVRRDRPLGAAAERLLVLLREAAAAPASEPRLARERKKLSASAAAAPTGR